MNNIVKIAKYIKAAQLVDLGSTHKVVETFMDAALKDLEANKQFKDMDDSDKKRMMSRLKTLIKFVRRKDEYIYTLDLSRDLNKKYQIINNFETKDNHSYNPFN